MLRSQQMSLIMNHVPQHIRRVIQLLESSTSKSVHWWNISSFIQGVLQKKSATVEVLRSLQSLSFCILHGVLYRTICTTANHNKTAEDRCQNVYTHMALSSPYLLHVDLLAVAVNCTLALCTLVTLPQQCTNVCTFFNTKTIHDKLSEINFT